MPDVVVDASVGVAVAVGSWYQQVLWGTNNSELEPARPTPEHLQRSGDR